MATGGVAAAPAQLGIHNPASSGQVKTMQGMAHIDGDNNPYIQFGEGDNVDAISVDDGINMDESPETSEKDGNEEAVLNAMPSKEEVLKEFQEYLELLAPLLKDQEEEELRRKTIEEKWKIVSKEHQRASVYPPKTYVENLQKHLHMRKKKASQKKMAKEGLSPLAFWLGKLKHDLKMSPESFVQEFVSDKYNGIDILIDVLKEIGMDQAATMTTKKSKMDIYKQCQNDEYDCLLCLKFATKIQEGVRQLVRYHSAVETVAHCSVGPWMKTRVTTLEVLTVVCDEPEGHQKVLDAFTAMHIKTNEPVPFKNLVSLLSIQGNVHFQTTCVRFLNKVVSATDNGNTRVYLQHLMKLAGFDPDDLDRYFLGQGVEFDMLQQELDTWRRNYVNLNSANQDMVDLERRNLDLRHEVDRLAALNKGSEKEKESWNKKEDDMKESYQKMQDRATELQDLVNKLTTKVQEAGVDLENIDVGKALGALGQYNTVRGLKGVIPTSASSDSLDQGSSLPPPAPPQPPPTPDARSATIRHKLRKRYDFNMPLYHWHPLYTITGSLFEDIDEEEMLRQIDFSDFEDRFNLPAKIEGPETRKKREIALKKVAATIKFVEPKRANNMIITQKKTGLTINEVAVAIDKCQRNRLSGESVQLLLKFLPTKEEIKQLAEHKDYYHDLGEAEKFLFLMVRIERVKSKMNIMAFMGVFDELVDHIKPAIVAVKTSSDSVMKSAPKLRNIMEIILAFGNFLNCNKRGFILGFKIDSLTKLRDVKSTDKSTSLLNYLVEWIETHHPELARFYEDIDIGSMKGASYQGIAADMHGLRSGIDLLRFERENQPGNAVIESFLKESSDIVTGMWDEFKAMESAYTRVCRMFGESPKEIEPDELFKYLSEFFEEFKRASIANYERDHPPVVTPRTPIGKPQAKALATEASKRANTKSGSTSTSPGPSPSQAMLKPVPGGSKFLYPPSEAPQAEDKTRSVEVYDDTALPYDDVLVDGQPIYSDVHHTAGDTKLSKSHSKVYRAKVKEPVYGSVIKKSTSTKTTESASKSEPNLPPPRRLHRTVLNEGAHTKGPAPKPPTNKEEKESKRESRPDSYSNAENIYQDIPVDIERKKAASSGLPNGTVPSGSKKGQAPPVPKSRGRRMAEVKQEKNENQVSSVLAQLDAVVNNPSWNSDDLSPEKTEDSRL